MSLPYIYARAETADDWSRWTFNHAANHYDWIPSILRQKNLVATQYLLDPVDPNNLGMWLYEHQSAHDQANAALGTQGYNLLELDLKDERMYAMWLRLNGAEHQRISAALGVG